MIQFHVSEQGVSLWSVHVVYGPRGEYEADLGVWPGLVEANTIMCQFQKYLINVTKREGGEGDESQTKTAGV